MNVVADSALQGAPMVVADDQRATRAARLAWDRYRPIAISLPLFMATSYLAWRQDSPPHLGHLPLLTWIVLCFAGAVTPVTTFAFALRISDTQPLIGPVSWRMAFAHAGAVIACSVVDFIARAVVIPRSPIPVTPHSAGALLLNAAIAYLIFVLACQGFRTARDAKKAEAARARLRAELAEASRRRAAAELRALKAELNPHFLGNALQGVKALMRTDVDAAQRVLAPLADLLRTTLTRASTQETTLGEEIDALRPFVDVERARLRGRLDLQFDIDDASLDLLVPDMILQPLVENAVKHGLIPFGGGRIRVAARPATGESLELTVEDDGVALGSVGTTRSSTGGGVGLANIRARLAELYGSRASLELARGGLGTVVRVTLPLRHTDTAEPLGVDSDDEHLAAVDEARVGVPKRYSDESWAGRGWRVLTMASTIGLWFVWTMNNVAGDMRIAIVKGYDDKRLYSIVDGIAVGSLMVIIIHVAFWLSRRVPVVAQGARSALVAVRVLVVSILCGTACALVLCSVKLGLAALFGYADLLILSHVRHNVWRSVAMLDTLFVFACVIAQSYYAIRGSQAASRLRRRLRMELDDTQRQRADAELRALKSELNPHFIGNALNAVSVLMRTDPAAASRVIDQLSDLLRTAVDRAATQEVTLREELESLQPFLAVERIRLGRALDVSLNVDERTLDGRVPHMILQPLVENAVKHGFALRSGGHIEVRANRGEAYLELRICDDGSGLAMPSPVSVRRPGTGLANTRARLSKLYGQSASLELSSVPEGGAVATLLIPWHEHDRINPHPPAAHHKS